MAEFKGTKGKGFFVETHQHPTEKDEYHSVIQMDKFAISIVNTKCISIEETEANAKVMACSFEMLEILIELSYDFEDERLNSIIKKATE